MGRAFRNKETANIKRKVSISECMLRVRPYAKVFLYLFIPYEEHRKHILLLFLLSEEPGGPHGVAKSRTQLSNKHARTSFRPNMCGLAHLIKDA